MPPQKSSEDLKRYLDPKTISGLQSLDLKARLIVEGFLLGLHKSPYHGFSIEFSQHRQYMQGDAPKDIDWKVYAKTDRYYVKQYEEETNLKCHILLDISKSMTFSSASSLSKLDYSSSLAASLSYLLLKQKDAVGLGLYAGKIEKLLPPKASSSYIHQIISTIANLIPSNETNTAFSLGSIAEKIHQRGLIVVISDFFDDFESVMSSLKHFRFNKSEVIVFQVLDPLEKSFAFNGDSVFKDLESGEEITTQPHQIQKAYKESMSNFISKFKTECTNNSIDYNQISTSDNFDKALFAFLQKRSKII